MSPEKRSELSRLVNECVATFFCSEAGARQLRLFASAAEQARRNYRKVLRSAAPEAVLLKLLPHHNTSENRSRGAWIHPAPAIARDIKSSFEFGRWTPSEDWAGVAGAITGLIEVCLERPEDLDRICREFSALPAVKRLRVGLLTPILNALAPDRFLLVNPAAQLVINHFMGTAYDASMSAYPELNRAGWQLVEAVKPAIDSVADADLPLSMVFCAFCQWLTVRRRYFEGGYWKIAPAEAGRQWDEWRENGVMTIGWDALGDLSGLSRREFEQRRNRVTAAHGGEPGWSARALNQAYKFARIKPGDRVIVNQGKTRLLGIGTVTGPYYFVPNARHGHRLPVQWDDVTERQINETGWGTTLVPLSKERFYHLAAAPPVVPTDARESPAQGDVADRIVVIREEADTQYHDRPPYTLQTLASDTNLDEELLASWVRSIERKGQAIVYGPPGTGKTYVAERLARHLIAGGDGFWRIVQFHPAYAYEDFIQGIRPRAGKQGLEYPVVPGRFLEFCRGAAEHEGTCVLIIDEINRADLARVFGELMYLLEYRDRDVPLAVSGEKFRIPKNVRLLGTMNTADRSIALVDHALRRRFAFLALNPNYATLLRYHARTTGFDAQELVRVLREVNQRIEPRYQVGITYFLRPDLPDHLEDIWRTEIETYLEEYFFDQPATADAFTWERIGARLLP